MSNAAQKLRERKQQRARDRAATAATPAAPPSLSLEEAAARIARLERERERMTVQTKQLLEAERAKAKKAEAQAAKIEAERAKERLRASVLKSATALGAVDPEDVADLVLARHRFVASPEGKIVREDDATADLDTTLKTMLDGKPHLVRSTVASGTGAAPVARTAGPTSAPTKSFREDPNAALAAFAAGLAAPSTAKSGQQH